MLKFIFNKTFFIQAVVALGVIILSIWIILSYLNSYTLNGQTVTVPSLKGLKPNEIEETLRDKNLRFEIIDSVFLAKSEKGVVVEQYPAAEDLVKENRTIYVTLSKVVPPKIAIPDIIDMSSRLAIAKLESYGLKAGRLDYVPSECLNCVVKLTMGGKTVNPNDLVDKGSTVHITLGSGTSSEKIPVPTLINLTKNDAISALQLAFLNVGAEIYEDCKSSADSARARVFKQSQPANSIATLGSSIDIWLTTDSSKINITLPAVVE